MQPFKLVAASKEEAVPACRIDSLGFGISALIKSVQTVNVLYQWVPTPYKHNDFENKFTIRNFEIPGGTLPLLQCIPEWEQPWVIITGVLRVSNSSNFPTSLQWRTKNWNSYRLLNGTTLVALFMGHIVQWTLYVQACLDISGTFYKSERLQVRQFSGNRVFLRFVHDN